MTLKDFKILRSLGEGAFGEVYLAKCLKTGNKYALKSIDKVFLAKQRKEHHVFQEKLILQHLSHPMVVKLAGTFQDKQKLYFLMENLPNGELAKYLKFKKTIDMKEAQFFIASIVKILEYLHFQGVVHRDLKPENLILDENNNLKIIDFGTADVMDLGEVNLELFEKYQKIRKKYVSDREDSHEQEDEGMLAPKKPRMPKKSFVGTVYYIAPEMLVLQDVDQGADLWALGITLYKMLTGQFLFNQANDYMIFQEIKNGQYEMDKGIDDLAKHLISKLLMPKPKDRLGNGPKGSETDMESLKKHKFFDGINWDTLGVEKSPIKVDYPQQSDSEDMSEEELMIQKNKGKKMKVQKKIILSGLVKKMKYMLMYNTRQLILYSNGLLEYFDPTNSSLKGKIHIDKSCKVFAKTDMIFHLQRPEREYIFQCIDVKAKKWVAEISLFLKQF